MNTFETLAPITAVVEIPAGRVQVIAADRADTIVEVRPADPSKGRDVKAAEQVDVEYVDGVLKVTAAPARNRVLGSSGSVEVIVQLPADSHVQATAAAAEFTGAGRLGQVAVEGAYGKQTAVKLDEAAGVKVSAHSGDIHVGRLTGAAEIATNAGDIVVAEAGPGAVVLRTQSGDLSIGAANGDLSIGAANGVAASLDAGTSYGRITNTLMNTTGTPALAIHATTSHGDITAHSN